ncbi:uncharacterized protein LOC126355398 [Schistocerca gregaria]|uniref:uncharacterized protein LOC126355398 n=1 Tax=Schistocerca gregaria TaxID=7010 RepID=UPI00211E4C93|nr:uncharacterized protein LOC126355398 [Schistocerca gregaria]
MCAALCSNSCVNKLCTQYTGGGRYVVRAVVLFVCTLVVILQLMECFGRLIEPPVSTHSRITFNKTMTYPAVTICRAVGYKEDVLLKYKLGTKIHWTSEWRYFPYENASLQQFWDEATYTQDEVLVLYGLYHKAKNVEVTSKTFFNSGRCYTLKPLTQVETVGRVVGYSVTLNYGTYSSRQNTGWSIYIHDQTETWSENSLQISGQQDSFLLDLQEELHLRVAAQQYKAIGQVSAPCNASSSYSYSACEELCCHKQLAENVGCSAPWLSGVDMPHCSNYTSNKKLMDGYMNNRCNFSICGCPRRCVTTNYMASVRNRRTFHTTVENHNMSQLYVFFTLKTVTTVQEHFDYDFTMFLADVGAILGFLLGLSVLGLIAILEHVLGVLIQCVSVGCDKESKQQTSAMNRINNKIVLSKTVNEHITLRKM